MAPKQQIILSALLQLLCAPLLIRNIHPPPSARTVWGWLTLCSLLTLAVGPLSMARVERWCVRVAPGFGIGGRGAGVCCSALPRLDIAASCSCARASAEHVFALSVYSQAVPRREYLKVLWVKLQTSLLERNQLLCLPFPEDKVQHRPPGRVKG